MLRIAFRPFRTAEQRTRQAVAAMLHIPGASWPRQSQTLPGWFLPMPEAVGLRDSVWLHIPRVVVRIELELSLAALIHAHAKMLNYGVDDFEARG